ncbi:MAG: M67 family metallopeptidase [Anaeromyxobacteraceae bacterium]
MTAPAYPPDLLARISSLCEADPEREVCGFVVRRGGALEVLPVENVADRYHARDPAAFPRTSRDSYLMDPRAQLRVHEGLAATGGEIVAVWHSHVEVGAYFSEKDRADAAVDGAQVLPGVEYLVFGVRGGRVTEVKRYRFEAAGFQEDPLD